MQRIGALNALHSSVKQTTNIYIVECSVGNITTRRLADWHGPLLCAQCIGVYCSADCCTDGEIGWVHCCVHTCPVLGTQCTLAQCCVHTFAQCSAMEREAPGSLGRVDWRGQSLKSSKEQQGIVKEKNCLSSWPLPSPYPWQWPCCRGKRDCEKVTPIIHFMWGEGCQLRRRWGKPHFSSSVKDLLIWRVVVRPNCRGPEKPVTFKTFEQAAAYSPPKMVELAHDGLEPAGASTQLLALAQFEPAWHLARSISGTCVMVHNTSTRSQRVRIYGYWI